MGSFCWSCSAARCWLTTWRRTSLTSSASWRASNPQSGHRAGVLPTSSARQRRERHFQSHYPRQSHLTQCWRCGSRYQSTDWRHPLPALWIFGRAGRCYYHGTGRHYARLSATHSGFCDGGGARARHRQHYPGARLTGWERYARVVRAEVLALREREFVQAARAIGVPTPTIIFRHITPNTFSLVIVMATLQIAQAILAEAALSFLGLGTGQTYPSWG